VRSQETKIPATHSVAIIGLGPKGLYCLERLLAEFNARPLSQGLQIHLFNRSVHFGASPIYDPELPEYILVNVSVGEIDLWTAEAPPIAAGRGPDFVTWYQETLRPDTPLTGNEYLSRGVVGRYLIEGFVRILKNVPANVTISCHVGDVRDIRPRGPGYFLEFVAEDDRTDEFFADKVLLATGHSQLAPTAEEQNYHAFAARHPSAAFLPFVYPVVESMKQVPARSRVAMKGVGLTFIDGVLELTEGRGGRFERLANGSLAYTPSGREPSTIVGFSRTGLPMTPKAWDQPLAPRPLTFFTSAALTDLTQAAPGGKLDFESDLWPLFELEMELNYYRVAMGTGDERARLESCGPDARAMRRVIDSFLRRHPEQERFNCRAVIDPVGEHRFERGVEFALFVERYMEQEIARARLGQAGCGIKAAIEVWYEVRSALGSVLQFGGLTPKSHRQLIEHYYPRLKRVAFGPPIINIEKLLALQRAGLLDFTVARNPRVTTDERLGCFKLQCDEIPGAVAQAEILINATYPAVNIRQDATPLYRNLRERGMVRAYENRSSDHEMPSYCPGAIDMTAGPRFIVDEKGIGNVDISVIGIPTEGNLVGNLTLTRDGYAGIWAASVMDQLRRREHSSSHSRETG
jgi:FAD-NAD(P)-binding